MHGAALTKYLLAITSPKHQAATHGAGAEPSSVAASAWARRSASSSSATRPTSSRRPAASTPPSWSLIDESLVGRVEKAGVLDTGQRISPGQARRIACEAGIIPAVLGGDSQPLDVGRKRRYFTDTQRVALMLRDRGCTAEGCDRTTAMTHAHHDTRWTDGGTTDLANGRLLCSWHHAKAHDTTYEMTHRPGGKVAFHRRR